MESYRKSPGTVTHAASVIKHKAGMFSMKDTLSKTIALSK